MTRSNLALVRALHALWSGETSVPLDEIYAPDFIAHWPPSADQPTRCCLDGVSTGLQRLRSAFPDWREDIVDIFGDGDRVATRLVSCGTQHGAFAGIAATGRRVEIHELAIFRINNGRVAEQWCLFDEVMRWRQLGVSAEFLRQAFPNPEPS